MIPCQRDLFGVPEDLAYLNAAYLTPLMKDVREAGVTGVARKGRPWDIHLEDFYELPERGRAAFAGLIGADTQDIAIVAAASYGLQVAASNLPAGSGQKIIILADQFPSNVYVWRELASLRGADLVTVPRPDDWDWTAAILAHIDARTAIVALPHCHWTDGTVIDIKAVGAGCREVGAGFVLDVTQSLGAFPFDVTEVRPDFLVCATYKWLLGPYSVGFLYAAPERQNGRPIEFTPFARERSNDPNEWYSGQLHYRDGYQPGARRYDVGERSNFALLPMAITAIEKIREWRVDEINATLRGMTDEIAQRSADTGLIVPPPERRAGHMIGVRFPGTFPSGLNRRLEEDNVHVSCRADSMRVSPHVYNNGDDLDRLFDALEKSL